MNLTPEQIRQNAAAMIAFADGKPIQCRWHGGEWKDVTGACWDFEACEYRPKPWSLPAPPTGRKWHRDDWTEEMLPMIDGKQTRPLLADEKITEEDWRLPLHLSWAKNSGDWKSVPSKHPNYFFRTTRPLPSEPKVRGWNKPEDVPGPVCWLRECEEDEMPILITGFLCSTRNPYKGCAGVITNIDRFREVRWSQLSGWQHSTDRKTWLPCTITEQA